MSKNNKGFTLVEIMIASGLLSFLVFMGMNFMQGVFKKNKDFSKVNPLNEINITMDMLARDLSLAIEIFEVEKNKFDLKIPVYHPGEKKLRFKSITYHYKFCENNSKLNYSCFYRSTEKGSKLWMAPSQLKWCTMDKKIGDCHFLEVYDFDIHHKRLFVMQGQIILKKKINYSFFLNNLLNGSGVPLGKLDI